MKLWMSLMLIASGAALVCFAGSDGNDWTTHDEGTTSKTLSLTGSPARVVVDNIEGYVHVKAVDGRQVHVTAHKIIRAETDRDLQQARDEVKLEITEQPGSVSVYYAAPWRCDHDSAGCRDQQHRSYSVRYDLDVEVPRAAQPVISTVNQGDIRVDGTAGDFVVRNVNGAIAMTAISGSGDASTINGPISVHFTKNPSSSSRFRTLNGPMNIYFQASLSADLRFKTFNGEIFSDFDVTPVAMPVAHGEKQEGRFVYHSNGFQGARTGTGGPELSFDAFNGSIRLHQEGKGVSTK